MVVGDLMDLKVKKAYLGPKVARVTMDQLEMQVGDSVTEKQNHVNTQ